MREVTQAQITAHNARVASWVYNDKLRAAEANRPEEEREARRQSRLEAARRYREKNRDELAHRERQRRRHEEQRPNYKKIARDLKAARRQRLAKVAAGAALRTQEESELPHSPTDLDPALARFPDSLQLYQITYYSTIMADAQLRYLVALREHKLHARLQCSGLSKLTRTEEELRDIEDKIDTEHSALAIMSSGSYSVNDTAYHAWSWVQTDGALNNLSLPPGVTSERHEKIIARLARGRKFAARFKEHEPCSYIAARTIITCYKEYLTYGRLLADEEARLRRDSSGMVV
ncbi:hypothetical protein DFH07DRAFT_769621 [Mycena maculata]|uniref:Uncharacterized protein n=1 Tax=Mycena maculata TaxID=230809 RepID=A0AAD7JQT5_9AGAR|nr:hypothetical protein DFH07DRAFT_769621 [Mycena maculata]